MFPDSNYTLNNADISIYPNPAFDVIYLSTENLSPTETTIEIYSIEGKLIHEEVLFLNQSEATEINIHEWPSGLYILKVQTENWSDNFNVVKH